MKINDKSLEVEMDRLKKERKKWTKESDGSKEVEIDRLRQAKVDERKR
jgi:hypothetical protein